MEPVIDRTGLALAIKQAMIDLDFSEQDRRKIKALMLQLFMNRFEQFKRFHKTQCPHTMMLEGRYVVENEYPINNEAYQYYRVIAYNAELGQGQYLSSSTDKGKRKLTVIEGYCKTDNKRKTVKSASKPKVKAEGTPSLKSEFQSKSSASLPKTKASGSK